MNKTTVYGSSLTGMRAMLAETLIDIGRKDDHVLVIDCETGTATNILGFKERFPERYVTTGVAEQSGLSFAFGVARSGYRPIIPLFSSFLTRRACDQIFIQAGYANADIKMIGCYSGLTTPNTGATHQSINDTAIMRSIPNITVIETADPYELQQALYAMMDIRGPVYLRMIRGDIPKYDIRCISENYRFSIGKSTILKSGTDLTLIGSGLMVSRCLEAAQALEEAGISTEVINLTAIKPFDADPVIASARKTGKVVTAENHSVIGGIGSAVAECLSEYCPVPVKRLGIMDCFGESGSLEDLFRKHDLTGEAVLQAALSFIKECGT